MDEDPTQAIGNCIFADNATCHHPSCKGGLIGKFTNGVVKYLQSSPCCADVVRDYCAQQNTLNIACHLENVRLSLGLTGYKKISTSSLVDGKSIVAIANLSAGMKYYFGMYALNEIGYSRPTFSMSNLSLLRLTTVILLFHIYWSMIDAFNLIVVRLVVKQNTFAMKITILVSVVKHHMGNAHLIAMARLGRVQCWINALYRVKVVEMTFVLLATM